MRPPFQLNRSWAWRALLVGVSAIGNPVRAEPSPEQIEFFENRIRPVLIESCYRCHSAESGRSRGGLLLDTRDALRKGGDSGPALVPGEPDASLLVKAIRYTDKELQMPPKSAGGALPSEQSADLEAWVLMGAPDPRVTPAVLQAEADAPDPSAARRHWAFQRVEAPPVPRVQDAGWVRTPVDAFVLAKLEAHGLRPAPPADRRTWLRRVCFDLIGLPPSPEEMAAFLADTAPDAHERVVERLLASPRYGERWGRHWLDVARFADTKGYVFQEERRFAFSYTYRDYVVAAFNNDKPYDQFLLEQIAADRLVTTPPKESAASSSPASPSPETQPRKSAAPAGTPPRPGAGLASAPDRSALAALGFLTLGRRFLNNQNDIIDDRIDVVMRGTQGLTVGCARCHDHKFDPISMADYYALHGVFASSREPEEKPLLGGPLDPAQHEAFLNARAEVEARREAVIETEVQKWLAEQRAKAADYRQAAEAALELPPDANLETFAGERKVAVEVLRQWMTFLKDRPAAENPTPGAAAPPDLSGAEVRRIIARHLDNQTVKHRQELAALEWQHPGAPARAMALEDTPNPHNSRVFVRGNPRNPGAEVPRRFVEALAGPDPAPFTDGSGRLELARAIASRDNPLTARVFVNRVWGWRFGAPLVSTPSDFGIRTEPPEHRDLLDWLAVRFMEEGWSVKKLHRLMLLSSTYRQAPVGSESVVGESVISRSVISGSVFSGSVISRSVISRSVVSAAVHGDPRPRVWQPHEAPTPPGGGLDTDSLNTDLLITDLLNTDLLNTDLLNTDPLNTDPLNTDPLTSAKPDPENRLLHRFPRRRLDFEALRDALLATAGNLDLTPGGQPVDILAAPFSGRRTVYGFIDRQNLPGAFRTFDLANPDVSSPGRFTTTVPQQALFMMNSPFVIEQARTLAAAVATTQEEAAGRIRALFDRALQRPPDPNELELAVTFLSRPSPDRQPVVTGWQYGTGRFDEEAKATADFVPMRAFTAGRVSPAMTFPLPDDRGYASLNAGGGHPGNTAQFAVIRRWTCPVDGVVRVTGRLRHESDQGDGVRGRLVRQSGGPVTEWRAFNSRADAELADLDMKRGETLDFIVDCLTGPAFDSFSWAPTIHLQPKDPAGLARVEWRADADFGPPQDEPPPLTRLEQFAQVLLLSNEFAFVD